MKMNRVIVLVADGFGVGELPDAGLYHDVGSNTLGHVCKAVSGLALPTLEKLGMGCLGNFEGIAKVNNPKAIVSRLGEQSRGKDTTTGHWELCGVVTREAFETFPHGFGSEILDPWLKACNLPGVLGNKTASGTAIIDELGGQHLETGKPIVYTSADSVMQIAAHEKYFGLERLYQVCEVARAQTLERRIGRIIARPFTGDEKNGFTRTERRRDYSISPPPNLLDVLVENNVDVYGVGKIEDIFAHRSLSFSNHTGNNLDSLRVAHEFFENKKRDPKFIFANLVDFDQLYGHRRDPIGYAKALSRFDEFLPRFLSAMTDNDLLIVTSDHGCDPTFQGTDHTREYVPFICYSPSLGGKLISDRTGFGDLSKTVLSVFQIDKSPCEGLSVL